MTEDEFDTSRTEVKTYMPAYQKEEWRAHADRLDMSQSEFVRTMVQAGRRQFSVAPEEGGSNGSNPRGNDLEDRILDLLAERGTLDWDELVEALTDDVEDRMEDALDELQSEDLVRYSGREGGYVIVEVPE